MSLRILTRAERLTYIANELKVIQVNLITLTGSPRCAESRMCQDLELAVQTMATDASKPRSSASTIRRWRVQGAGGQ
jgi:hypothetical protein